MTNPLSAVRRIDTPHTPVPALALLGDHRYAVMITSAGGGISRQGAMLVNRWRNDATRDGHGQWIYVRNAETGETWSAGHNPVGAPFTSYEAELSGSCARIARRDGAIETLMEVVALPEGTGEARRISLTNHSAAAVELEVTTYQEIVLASAVSDRGHRAFGNLFVQTERVNDSNALLAMRRPRSAADRPAWCGHAVASGSAVAVSFETDRARFIGRGRTERNPVAMTAGRELSGTAGAVLDPVLALRVRVSVSANGTSVCAFSTFVAGNRDEAEERAHGCSDFGATQRAIAQALEQGDPAARELKIDDSRASELQLLAGDLLYGTGRIADGTRDDLIAIGPSGDFPIVRTIIEDQSGLDAVKHLVDMQAYWARKGLRCDLVIVANDSSMAKHIRDAVAPADTIFVVDGRTAARNSLSLLDGVARLRLRYRNGWLEKSDD